MSNNTKILVLKAREIIYTLIFAVLGIALIILLIYMFSDKKENKEEIIPETTVDSTISTETSAAMSDTTLVPGNYKGTLNIGGTILDLEVSVDDQCIPTISLTGVDDTIASMYPVLLPTIDNINVSLSDGTLLDNITYTEDNKYTTILIINAIKNALANY